MNTGVGGVNLMMIVINEDMEEYELYDRHIIEHHAKFILFNIGARMAMILGLFSPLIFLLIRTGLDFFIVLGIFLFVALLLRLAWVRAYNQKRIHFYVYSRMKIRKEEAMQSMFQ